MAVRSALSVTSGTPQGQSLPRIELGFRAFTAVIAFIATILLASTVDQTKKRYKGSDWTDGFPIASLLIAFLYNIFKIAFTVLRRQSPTIPSTTADLVSSMFVWTLGVPAIVFSVGEGWYFWWQPVVYRLGDGRIPCRSRNFWSEHCQPLIYKLGKMEIAANVFLALVIIIHFVLFVRACIMIHRLRKQRNGTQTEARNIQLQYHRSPEEHQKDAPAFTLGDTKRESAASPVSPVSTLTADEVAVKYA